MLKELVALEERQFSVVAEMEDGRTQVVPVRAERAGDAFRQVKAMPGVRRVGRVAEGRLDAPPRPREQSAPADESAERTPEPQRPALPRDVLIGRVMTGPRVVIDARRSGVERPFAHIPPSDRPMPPAPPKPVVPPPPPPAAVPQVATPVAPAPQAEAAPAQVAPESAPAGREYRILKSRRRDGMPYLLQRGSWRDGGGKRVFESDWEKGFATREEAEKHMDWLKHTEQEIAQLNHVA